MNSIRKNQPIIFVISPYRSGGHWFTHIYNYTLRDKFGFVDASSRLGDYKPSYAHFFAEGGLLPGEYMMAHFHYIDELNEFSKREDVRLVINLRDIRDRVASMLNALYFWKKAEGQEISFEQYVESEFMQKTKECAEEIDAFMSINNIYKLYYEMMLSSPSQTLINLFKFFDLDLSSSHASEVLEKCSFKNLSGGREKGHEDKKSPYRKGISGDWKNFFTESQKERMKPFVDPLHNRLGYQNISNQT